MKAVLDENQVITIYPETVSEKIVIQYMNEGDAEDRIVILSENIHERQERDYD